LEVEHGVKTGLFSYGRHGLLALLLISSAPTFAAQNSSQTQPQSAQPTTKAKAADATPPRKSERKTAMQVPEPSSLILFGGAILLLLIARQFGRARIKPLPEEKWAQD
jgi:PEP-CTERM motif